MIEYLKLRTLVIGNSGSGKSSFAEGLGALIHAPVSDLDFIIGKTMGSEPSKTKICLGRRLPTSPRHSVGSSKACTGRSPKSQFQEQRPLCGWMSLGMSAGRGCRAWPALRRDRGRFCRAPQMGRSLPGSPDADILERSSIDNYPLEPSSTDDLRLRGAP